MPAPQLKPIPETVSETETQQPNNQNKIVDIADFFSKESLSSIREAAKLSYSQKKGEVKVEHLLYILSKNPKITTLLSPTSLNSIFEKSKDLINSQNENNVPFAGLSYFSPDLKKVLFGAYFIAKQEGSREVSINHLFSAISSYPLLSFLFSDVSLNSKPSSDFTLPPALGKFSKDLTSLSLSNELSFIGREQELEQILRILTRQNKHHVILLGDSGVGKTSLGTGLAKFLTSRELPSFSGARVLSLDLGGLFSSPQNVSFFVPKIIEEVGSLPKIIFLLDQITLLQGNQQISMLINFLQTLEKQGQVYFLLSTTPSFYNQFLSSNPYFSSFFEVIKIEEFTPEMTEKILIEQSSKMEKFHKVSIDENVFLETTYLSKRYLSGNLPQKAISLLEEACASAALAKKTQVTVDDVKNIIAQKTGIPINSLTVSEKEKLNNLENILNKFVIGQDEAIKKVSEALRRARAGLKDPKKPIGSFLFLGPTGVGKTELAKTLAKIFFDDEKAFIRLDMSEYSESHTAQRLIGSPPGYVGYEEGGQLTNPIIERPYSLILLDEIEKANSRVFDLFLQVLDDGRLTDSKGKTVDFKNTLLIFTSNIASEEIFAHGEDLISPNFNRKEFYENNIMPIVRQYFRPEFINRFDDIVLFNPLTKNELIKIGRLKINLLSERLKEKGITLIVSDKKIEELVSFSYNPSFGARPLERAIREQIENVIAQKLISGEIKGGQTIKW